MRLSILSCISFLFIMSSFNEAHSITLWDPIDTTKTKKEVAPTFYDTSEIFTKDWKVNTSFPYADKSYAVLDTVNFTDSLHGYAFPAESPTSSHYGRRRNSFHKGIDIPLRSGSEIFATFDGKVRYATYNGGGFGRLIVIRHDNGLETYYAHLSKLEVKINQVVKAGDLIGLSGSTGRSYSPHLHYEVRYHDKPINPEIIFDVESYCLKNESAMIGELYLKKDRHQITAPTLSAEFLAKGTVYSIQSGDTLSKIAAKSGTTISALCALNGMNRASVLQIGQKIRLN